MLAGCKDGDNRCREQSTPSTKADPHGSEPFAAAAQLAFPGLLHGLHWQQRYNLVAVYSRLLPSGTARQGGASKV